MKITLLLFLMAYSLVSFSQEKQPLKSTFIENARLALERLKQEESRVDITSESKVSDKRHVDEISIYPNSLSKIVEQAEPKDGHYQRNKSMPTSTTLFEVMYPGSNVPVFNIESEGKSSFVGLLEVDGASTNKAAYNAGSSAAIDFSKSNLAYTSSIPTAFTLVGIKDGGSYTLAVQSTQSGLASFMAEGFTFKSKNNGSTQETTDTLYSFLVIGTTVYYSMTTGL